MVFADRLLLHEKREILAARARAIAGGLSVRTGRCRHAGWNADGSERLARIWQIEEKVLRPRVTKRKTPQVLSGVTYTRRKRWDEVQMNSTGDG
mgnify:CR=1 FL=1